MRYYVFYEISNLWRAEVEADDTTGARAAWENGDAASDSEVSDPSFHFVEVKPVTT